MLSRKQEREKYHSDEDYRRRRKLKSRRFRDRYKDSRVFKCLRYLQNAIYRKRCAVAKLYDRIDAHDRDLKYLLDQLKKLKVKWEKERKSMAAAGPSSSP